MQHLALHLQDHLGVADNGHLLVAYLDFGYRALELNHVTNVYRHGGALVTATR